MRHRSQSALFICLLLVVAAATGCATTTKKMQAFAQRFRLKPNSEVKGALRETSVASINKKRDDVLLDAAIASWSDANTEETQKLLTQIIERTPQHQEARHLLADLLAAEQKFDAAAEHLQVVLDSNPEDAKAHYAMAMLLETIGDSAAAEKHLQQAKAFDPKLEQLANSVNAAGEIAAASFAEEAEPPATSPGGQETRFHLTDE